MELSLNSERGRRITLHFKCFKILKQMPALYLRLVLGKSWFVPEVLLRQCVRLGQG